MSDFRIHNGVASIIYNGARYFFSDIPSGLPTNAAQTPDGIKLEFASGDVINIIEQKKIEIGSATSQYQFIDRIGALYSLSDKNGKFFETAEIKLLFEIADPIYRILDDGRVLSECGTYVKVGDQIAIMAGDQYIIQDNLPTLNAKPGEYYLPTEIVQYAQVGITLIYVDQFYSYMAPLNLTKVSKYCLADENGNEYVISKVSLYNSELISDKRKIPIHSCISAKQPLTSNSVLRNARGKYILLNRRADGVVYKKTDTNEQIFVTNTGELHKVASAPMSSFLSVR